MMCMIANCGKKAEIKCSKCELEVCKNHSREQECIYCTIKGVVFNEEALRKLQAIIDSTEGKAERRLYWNVFFCSKCQLQAVFTRWKNSLPAAVTCPLCENPMAIDDYSKQIE